MSSKFYNKLVRDNIPKIIEKQGDIAKIKILSDEEYKKMLHQKLLEETNEFLAGGEVEELVDIAEVIYSILDFEQISIEEFEAIRQEKADKRGRFKEKIFLEEVISD